MKRKRRVLLIGWDAADWRVINPLMDAGGMPHLERLINAGVMGSLATLSPALSPMLWTSIATGKRPFKHGIYGFTEPDPHHGGVRAITNLSRKTRAIWNILHMRGLTSNVLAWWPSHPAEPIRGVMVSNHFHRAVTTKDKPWPIGPGTVHPLELADNLRPLRVHPQELDPGQVCPFIPAVASVDLKKDRRPISVSKIIAECASVHAAATALVQLEPWDFMAVYYDAIDHFSHGFMKYHPPRMPGIPEKDFELYKDVVTGGYRFHDMMLGVLMHLAGTDTTIILVSDHGFHPDNLRPDHVPHIPAGPGIQHRDQGIVVMAGPGIKRDEIVYGASLLDITPTILTIYGLPVGQDMDGKPLVSVFADPPEIETIPSWDDVPGEDGTHPPDMVIDSVSAREAVNQLVALGYIEKPDKDKDKAAEKAVRELRFNQAIAYMDANRHAEAAAILSELTRGMTNEYRYGVQLVACYQTLGRVAEARRELDALYNRRIKNAAIAVEKLRKLHDEGEVESPKRRRQRLELEAEAAGNPFAVEYLRGMQFLAEGDPEAALAYFHNAELINPRELVTHIQMGRAYLGLKRWNHAESSFRKVRDRNTDSTEAHLGLAWALLHQDRLDEAADVALKAISLQFANPTAHYLLGTILHRMGRLQRAIEALRVCVAQNPNHVYAHQRLADIYEKRVGNPDAAAEHNLLAQQARRNITELSQGELDAIIKTTEVTISDEDVFTPPPTLPKEIQPALTESIVLVSGLPRSGTSMMMRMLGKGGLPLLVDRVRPADTHNPKGYFEYTPVMSVGRDASWVTQAKGKGVKVVAHLLMSMPRDKQYHYRVIFMERALPEVLASQQDLITDRGETGARLSPKKLEEVYRKQLSRIRRLIGVGRFPILYVDHRDCITDPAGVAARVNGFLDGTLNTQAMAAAVDPVLYRHRMEKINAASSETRSKKTT